MTRKAISAAFGYKPWPTREERPALLLHLDELHKGTSALRPPAQGVDARREPQTDRAANVDGWHRGAVGEAATQPARAGSRDACLPVVRSFHRPAEPRLSERHPQRAGAAGGSTGCQKWTHSMALTQRGNRLIPARARHESALERKGSTGRQKCCLRTLRSHQRKGRKPSRRRGSPHTRPVEAAISCPVCRFSDNIPAHEGLFYRDFLP